MGSCLRMDYACQLIKEMADINCLGGEICVLPQASNIV